MENTNEKFFEELSDERNKAEEDYMKVELAKSSSGVMERSKIEVNENGSNGDPEGQLTVDVYQTANDIVIESAIAGVKPDDIDINVSSDSITIRGERKRENQVRDQDYFYQECYWGRFSRSVILPQEVDPESATVNFKNGILTVRLPKLNRKKSKKLKVKLE
ncbi:MAG: Hsp20/alpha crystallin family protein [Patescibacteria group bacterium]